VAFSLVANAKASFTLFRESLLPSDELINAFIRFVGESEGETILTVKTDGAPIRKPSQISISAIRKGYETSLRKN
jgi:hypothetical protein